MLPEATTQVLPLDLLLLVRRTGIILLSCLMAGCILYDLVLFCRDYDGCVYQHLSL